MSEPRKKADWPIVAIMALAAPLVGLAVYVGCYLGMSETHYEHYWDEEGKVATLRLYDAPWKATLFTPAARVESLLAGRRVVVVGGQSWSSY